MFIPEVIPIFVTTCIFNVTKQMLRHTAHSLKTFSGFHRLLSLFIFLICAGQIFGQTHSFSGTIGKYPIYFQLTIEGKQVSGYYFYKNKLVDISLSGSYTSGTMILKSSDEYGADITDPETFRFKWPHKAPSGSWSKKGTQLSLKLYPLTAKETGSPKCSNPYLIKTDPVKNDLTRVKIGLFRLKEIDSVRTINHITIRHFEEILTGIKLFRIDSGMDAGKQKDANFYLEYLQISEFLESLSCASYSAYGSEYSFELTSLSLSTDFMCFSVFKTYYCGGAHPNEDNYALNYNLNTGKTVSWSDYLIPGKDTIYNERIYAYLTKSEPGYFDESNSIESADVYMDCNYRERNLWFDCDFVFTVDGVKLLPSFAHFAAFCLEPEWAIIPYSELKDLIKPECYSKLTRLKN
ncbi:MAG: hypothetical protein K0S23_505 [Fluviicola sp.]|jgi:hypothetical protein|uniref:hypothetical protein n=1 Tax=Fluviicola sp. TaxID=1917219 RepID=UPI00260D308C|nr:hypothetical protein [Fluviicola sp.]MDF3026198.1 hypothetical protein [Fluviicola sp.]